MRIQSTSTYLLLIFVTSLITGCDGGLSRSTPAELGESVVTVIKNKDRDGLRSLTPTKDDLIATVQSSGLPADEKADAVEELSFDWDRREGEEYSEILEEFDEMIKEGEEEGTDFSTIKFKSCEVDEEKQRDGLTMADVVATFTMDGETFECKIRKATKTNSGWAMGSYGFRVRKKY